jgi:predicted nucleic acid-binding protein
MRPVALADTGFLLALLDRSDEWHEVCARIFQNARLPLLTSEAILTELFYLVGARVSESDAVWRFVLSGAIVLATITTADLPPLQELMSRYKDRPMDFADATLVHLALRESLSTILTVDHDDFETYRIGGRKRFTILPERRGKV